jgi:hypothetical protein
MHFLNENRRSYPPFNVINLEFMSNRCRHQFNKAAFRFITKYWL